jgi:hypothetical protein
MKKIVAIIFFVFSCSITVFCQTKAKEITSVKEVTYSKENFIGHFVTKENVHLKINKDGSYTWGESGGDWALTIKNGVFKVTFEDNYGEVAEGTVTFINKDKFTMLTKEYGTETYTRKK